MRVTSAHLGNRPFGKEGEPWQQVLQLIHRGLLESAQALMRHHNITPNKPALTELILECQKRAEAEKNANDIRASLQYQRRTASLRMLRDGGHISGTVLLPAVLPEGYCGKILLVFVKGDCISERTCLRSGDDWHREILRSFEEEVHDYGFEEFLISPQGGAFAEFQPDGTIALSGSSEEFGRCPMEEAINLIQIAFPHRDILWSDTIGR